MSIAKKILLSVKKMLTCTQQFLKKFAMGDRLELYMYRFAFKDKYTIGDIWLGRNGRKVCDTIEDKVRDLNHNGVFDNGEVKIPSETAIPCGRYRINMHIQSPHFKQKAFYNNLCKGYLPRLMDVPLFDGILIHCGNTAQDSAGCIIVGDNKQVGQVIDSQKRFVELYGILKRADDEKVPIYINIIDAKNGEHIARKAQNNDEPCKWDKHED